MMEHSDIKFLRRLIKLDKQLIAVFIASIVLGLFCLFCLYIGVFQERIEGFKLALLFGVLSSSTFSYAYNQKKTIKVVKKLIKESDVSLDI